MRNLVLLSMFGVVMLGASASAVTIDWVPVGNPGNACETQSQGCFGDVASGYLISKYEVTNSQYAEFLNAIADTDTNALYSTNMYITRMNGPGSYSYDAIGGRENMPVTYVTFYNTLRFANWLHNGQPAPDPMFPQQTNATTEDGAYTLGGSNPPGVARNANATIFLPSEDEWYKAAYHNALGVAATDYFDYPAGSGTPTTCTASTLPPNAANCANAVGDFKNVGSYTNSASPYGTYDQGGNAFEWNEGTSGANRVVRGGSFFHSASTLAASFRDVYNPASEGGSGYIGFRVASIPEPGTGLLVIAGLFGLAGWRRARA